MVINPTVSLGLPHACKILFEVEAVHLDANIDSHGLSDKFLVDLNAKSTKVSCFHHSPARCICRPPKRRDFHTLEYEIKL